MKVQVIKDKSGKVIGSFEASTAGGATIQPVLENGAKAEEMEVSANYKENPAELYKS